MATAKKPLATKRSPTPPGARSEQHNKERLKPDFGGMSRLLVPKPKLRATTKPRIK